MNTGFIAGIRRQIRLMASRKMYLFGMIFVPVAIAIFFVSLLGEGLPEHIPTAVVDLDHSSLSRQVTRSLRTSQLLNIDLDCESYDRAMEAVRRGDIFGFFVIPDDFERDALALRKPTVEFYADMTYFVPGTLSYKAFKTVAVTTAAGAVQQVLFSLGLSPDEVGDIIQPIVIDQFALHNPWMNYAYYMGPSFIFCTLSLMVILMTVFTITMEIKNYTSRQWLEVARGRMSMALLTKLLPMTVVFSATGVLMLWIIFGVGGFPLNGSLATIICATILMVIASQAFATFVCCVLPNPRLAFSVCALFGILSFSLAGFSFPVQNMYGWVGIFSWFAPIRYWFLIYINDALNGVALYYSRLYFAALLAFPLFVPAVMWHLRRKCLNPVYVP